MNNKTKKDWKNPDAVNAHDPIVNQDELREVNGGRWWGLIFTISAECSISGKSCNPFSRLSSNDDSFSS